MLYTLFDPRRNAVATLVRYSYFPLLMEADGPKVFRHAWLRLPVLWKAIFSWPQWRWWNGPNITFSVSHFALNPITAGRAIILAPLFDMGL